MTGTGIWEGLTTLIEIFDRTDASKTGSTGADSTNTKQTASDRPSEVGVAGETDAKAEKPLQDEPKISAPTAEV